ncbi:MAG: polymer-forming cytoskeletal protein [bacterium]|nr:polymer-forming cytoskeletal protein [bacterium]
MKLNSSVVHRVAAYAALVSFVCGISGLAQDTGTSDDTTAPPLQSDIDDLSSEDTRDSNIAWPGEAVFQEIELSPEGVVAFDSLGNRWYFDFDEDFFLLDPRAGDEQVGSEGRAGPDELEAAEERCTDQKIVRHPALKAVFVGYDEYVDGDITAYDRVTVKGWVRGDIQSYNKRVLVTASGRVDGDIKAPAIEVKDGGLVLGEQIVTEAYQIPPIDVVMAPFSSEGIWIVLAFALALLLIAFLAVSLAPRQLKNISTCIVEHKVKTYFTGLLFLFLLPLVVAILLITIVGIIAVALLPLSILIAMTLGMAVCGRMLGRSVLKSIFGQKQSLMFQSLFGVLVFVLSWALVAVLLGAGDSEGVVFGFGVLFLVLSIVATSYPLLAGIGAAVLTRFGFRQYVSFRDQVAEPGGPVPAPAPPPLSGRIPSSPSKHSPPSPPSFGRRPEPPRPSSGE